MNQQFNKSYESLPMNLEFFVNLKCPWRTIMLLFLRHELGSMKHSHIHRQIYIQARRVKIIKS